MPLKDVSDITEALAGTGACWDPVLVLFWDAVRVGARTSGGVMIAERLDLDDAASAAKNG